MKETTKTSRTAGYLEKIFRALKQRQLRRGAGRTHHHHSEHTNGIRSCYRCQDVERGVATLPEGGRMIEDIIKQVRKAAMELGMEVDELLEWLRAENNKKLPWEE